ncbi:hypothetical protein [Thiocapsa rosea]|uniref:CopG antitoxin of type II toxin-antitoxin system n=1 Tax=Thiocapsa rosea TaxID=69360 RepID=A0A495VCD2_9GAMM|nr:hypothetical protein [Thiocapsa rosea]RKT46924.1 hypothetical protein BDD21_4467 [Thiocapsa rosea]
MNTTPDHDGMPVEIDFSGGTRGTFFHPGAQVRLPIHLEAEVQSTLAAIANAKGIELSVLVNDLLRKDIELIQMAR